ncbi:hypothetical protein TSUD_339420 [Trifolium subterraneum]|nr:hypothetical protein TSUD_339420 [Trifolium subterraneum]
MPKLESLIQQQQKCTSIADYAETRNQKKCSRRSNTIDRNTHQKTRYVQKQELNTEHNISSSITVSQNQIAAARIKWK